MTTKTKWEQRGFYLFGETPDFFFVVNREEEKSRQWHWSVKRLKARRGTNYVSGRETSKKEARHACRRWASFLQ